MRKLTVAIALAALASAPRLVHAQASAQGATAAESPEAEQAIEKGFEMSRNYFLKKFKGSSFTYETAIGSGTFVRNGFSDNPYVANNFYFAPRFNFTKKLALTVRAAFSVEYTQPDSTGGNGSQGVRRFDPFDLWFTFSANNLYKEKYTGISLRAYGRLTAPISYAAQFRGETVPITAGFGLDRSWTIKGNKEWFTGFNVGYDFRVTKFFPTKSSFAINPQGASNLGIQCRDGEEFCAVNATGQSPNVSMVNTISAGVDITKKLSFGILLLFAKSWNFGNEIDQFSSPNAVAVGGADSTWGFVAFDYALVKHVSLSAGIWSFQPLRTRDNQGVRFPFFDFSTPYNNFTNFFLDVIVRL